MKKKMDNPKCKNGRSRIEEQIEKIMATREQNRSLLSPPARIPKQDNTTPYNVCRADFDGLS
jgi:hypothetical protein